jgi:phenylacetate-CoA ligase
VLVRCAFPACQRCEGARGRHLCLCRRHYIHPLVFRTPLGQNPDIAEYQVLQTEDGAKIYVVATGPIDITALHQEIVAGLAKSGLHNAQIEINLVDSLERHKETGKLKRFIPLKR